MQQPIIIAAFSDVHGPRYLHYLTNSTSALERADIVFIAGDIVDKGAAQHSRLVLDVVRSTYKGRVLAIFGNEEYDERESEIRSSCPDVTWLKDEAVHLEVKGLTLSVVGTRGILDEPTSWQKKNIPNIRAVYEERLEKIAGLLSEAKRNSQVTVLLTHYAPICPTLRGERPSIWAQMGSRRLTETILRCKPDLVIHGHAHNSTNLFVEMGSTRIHNVALPAAKKVTCVEVKVGRGLEAFF